MNGTEHSAVLADAPVYMGFDAPVDGYRVGLRLSYAQRSVAGAIGGRHTGIRKAEVRLLPALDAAEPLRGRLCRPEQDLRMWGNTRECDGDVGMLWCRLRDRRAWHHCLSEERQVRVSAESDGEAREANRRVDDAGERTATGQRRHGIESEGAHETPV